MVDRVQRAMEKMAPELEDYVLRKIFTIKEVKKITETRRQHENRLSRAEKKVNDFVQYLESEKRLERVRNSRIKKMGIARSEMDGMLARNVLSVYERALYYFHEPFLLKDFAEYAIKHKEIEIMKECLGRKCAKRPEDADLWIYTAQKLWEVNQIEDARNVFLKCASINNQTRVLVEFFRFECAYASSIIELNREIGLNEEDNGEIENGELALAVFRVLEPRANSNEIEELLEISTLVPGLQAKLKELSVKASKYQLAKVTNT